MNKVTLAGLACLAGTFLLLLFQAISSQMPGDQGGWKNLSLELVVGSQYFDWVDTISVDVVYNGINYLVNMPLYILLAVIGGALLVIGGMMWK